MELVTSQQVTRSIGEFADRIRASDSEQIRRMLSTLVEHDEELRKRQEERENLRTFYLESLNALEEFLVRMRSFLLWP